MKWLQNLNAGPETVPLIAMAVAAHVFGLPGIVLLLAWALIARSEANHYRDLLGQVHREAVKLSHHLPRPEDEIRKQVLATWRQKGAK